MPTPYITVERESDLLRARAHLRKKLAEVGRVTIECKNAYLGGKLRAAAYAWARDHDVHVATSHKVASGVKRFRAAIVTPAFADDDA